MPTTTSHIKCSNCGVFNTNREYCKNCGQLISFKKKRELKEKNLKKQLIDEAKEELENPNFVERLKKHPFFLIKFLGWFLYSVWAIVSAIGAVIAWFVAMVAAG